MHADYDLASDLALAQRAALAGAALGLRYFEGVSRLPQELKADGTIVTEADRAVEETVRSVLLAARPADACLGEETGEVGRGRRRWILDGIDGTAVFVQGIDGWQTLIALEVDGQVVLGMAIVPAQAKIWWGARGLGAHVADLEQPAEAARSTIGRARRLAVSPMPPSVAASRLAVVPPYQTLPPALRAAVDPLIAVTPLQPWHAHAALLVAAGALDLTVQVVGKVWDFAALIPIVEEAGGTFSGANGQGHPVTGTAVYANGPALHVAALALLGRTASA